MAIRGVSNGRSDDDRERYAAALAQYEATVTARRGGGRAVRSISEVTDPPEIVDIPAAGPKAGAIPTLIWPPAGAGDEVSSNG
jgi:hypothetical protein